MWASGCPEPAEAMLAFVWTGPSSCSVGSFRACGPDERHTSDRRWPPPLGAWRSSPSRRPRQGRLHDRHCARAPRRRDPDVRHQSIYIHHSLLTCTGVCGLRRGQGARTPRPRPRWTAVASVTWRGPETVSANISILFHTIDRRSGDSQYPGGHGRRRLACSALTSADLVEATASGHELGVMIECLHIGSDREIQS
jgi:hypothetical protein